MVAARYTEQHRRIALQVSRAVKHPEVGLPLVNDHERQAVVVARTSDPVEQFGSFRGKRSSRSRDRWLQPQAARGYEHC